MNIKQAFFAWSLDHAAEAIPTQALGAGILLACGSSTPIALLGGAIGVMWRFYGREHAQYEYFLARTTGYDVSTLHKEYFYTLNPFVWKQKADFFVPTIFAFAIAAIGFVI